MKKYIALLLAVMIIMASFVVPVSAATEMTGDTYGSYSGTPTGYSYGVTGEYRTRYYNSVNTRYGKAIVGHRSNVSTTKVVHVYGRDSVANTTKYYTINTKDYLSGNTVTGLTRSRSNSWEYSSTYYSYKTISASYTSNITSFVTCESIASGTTYVGYPNLFNIA